LLSRICELITEYLQYASENGLMICAIGIGTAGYVDRQGRIAHATNNIPGWSGFDLKGYIIEATGLPVEIVNDVYAITGGEAWMGAGRFLDRFLCVALGTGIGGCLWEADQPYRGLAGFAGASGHQVIHYGGKLCTCGQRGCWETYASVGSLQAVINEIDNREEQPYRFASPQRLFDMAREGNLESLEIVEQYIDYVSIGILNQIYTLNVEKIVIAGAISQQGTFLTDRVKRRIQKTALPIFVQEGFDVVPATLGDDAGTLGAASLVIEYVR
jgi:glucokinase